MQEVESFGLRQPLRLGDARREVFPRHDGLDRRERVAARLLSIEQHLADAGVEAYLVVDRLARRLELLLMLLLCRGEQLTDDPVVQVDDFVSDSGRPVDGERGERRIAPLRLEFGQIGGRHLTALAGDLEQAVLVNQALDAGRQVKRLPSLEAVDVLSHVA